MRIAKGIILFLCFFTLTINLRAQINPLKSQYFVNSFLINPSQAGAGERGLVSAGVSSQWNRMPGSPEIKSLTLEAPITERQGAGASIVNDKAGLLNRTVILGSYSYKVPFSENGSVRFGLAAGYVGDNLNVSDAVSPDASSDVALVNYNFERQNLFKAGFGATLRLQNVEIQSSWFSINHKKDTQINAIDRPGVTSTLKYTFGNRETTSFSPLIGYRQITGFSDYIDAGLNFSYKSILDLSVLYHTNKSITGGFSFDYKKAVRLSCFYNSETPQLRNLSGGTFEMSLGIPFSTRGK